ncbi:MAG TPA: DUF4129 domain-containing protein [Acidobacteriaceae bacterium]|nr:DUF4129 domain-containing protein [Acidobacteriaceae bacterium]
MPAISLADDAHVTVGERTLKPSTLADYSGDLHSMRSLAAACAQNASACDPARVSADEHVTLANKSSFDAHFAWMTDALSSAKSLPNSRRAALMADAEAHLDEDMADAQAVPAAPNFSKARKEADTILASREFNTSTAPSLRDQIIALLYRWLDRLLAHVAAFGSRSPWIGPLLEWGLGAIACSLLLVWAFRTMRRQRVRMQRDATRRTEQTDERVLNWMREAEEHAAGGRFRDAVHCLYWASIVTLEGRRFWQPDRARTPREYLRLLDPASAAAPLLRRQTFTFETIWYGLRPAARPDYDNALELHRQLRAA